MLIRAGCAVENKRGGSGHKGLRQRFLHFGHTSGDANVPGAFDGLNRSLNPSVPAPANSLKSLMPKLVLLAFTKL